LAKAGLGAAVCSKALSQGAKNANLGFASDEKKLVAGGAGLSAAGYSASAVL
jgi:hypothetical protein